MPFAHVKINMKAHSAGGYKILSRSVRYPVHPVRISVRVRLQTTSPTSELSQRATVSASIKLGSVISQCRVRIGIWFSAACRAWCQANPGMLHSNRFKQAVNAGWRKTRGHQFDRFVQHTKALFIVWQPQRRGMPEALTN